MRAVSTWALGAALLLLVAGVLVAPRAFDGRVGPGGLSPVAASSGVGVLPRGRAEAPGAGTSREPARGRPATAATRARAARVARGTPVPPPLTDGRAIAAARRFAAGRRGTVAFAVLEPSGRLGGLRRTSAFPSASVSKAMLMVAVLRRARERPLTPAERGLLEPMVTASDNEAADAVFAWVGDAGLQTVARAAGMRRFAPAGAWAQAGLTPADQARLFLRVDGLVPRRHRAYARELLAGIVAWQRWGIAEVVARRPGARVFFKGGWRPGLTHQVALVERGGSRIALAVMTQGGPDIAYDQRTIAGIARRVLLR